jgi:hypothetical protein
MNKSLSSSANSILLGGDNNANQLPIAKAVSFEN